MDGMVEAAGVVDFPAHGWSVYDAHGIKVIAFWIEFDGERQVCARAHLPEAGYIESCVRSARMQSAGEVRQ